MRRFHLGIDYGTSASKLVLRDFGGVDGGKAYLLEQDQSYRFTSSVVIDGRKLYFNAPPENPIAFRSIKMRFAEEITGQSGHHFYGTPVPFPENLTAEDLITLNLWRLISIGREAASKIAAGEDFRLGMTTGIPMNFFDDQRLRTAFLRVVRTAFDLDKLGGIPKDVINLPEAVAYLAEAREIVSRKPRIDDDRIRAWIRSEAEASMYWSFRSPSVPEGCYFSIDIGAGTTDANVFLIKDRFSELQQARIKDTLVFFGADSGSKGVEYLESLDLSQRHNGLNAIRETLIGAGRQAYRRLGNNSYAVNQWRDAKLILLGGGSIDDDVKSRMHFHPMANFNDIELGVLQLDVPSDLTKIDGSRILKSEVPFTSVAYGLAQIFTEVPLTVAPGQVLPVASHSTRELLTHEEIYGD